MCEKPLAHTLESADRIIAVAKKHPGRLSTVYQFRYLPEVQRALWLRNHGRLGKLLFGRFHRFAKFEALARPAKNGKPAKPAKKRSPWWGQWQNAGGGVVMTQLIHEIDIMQHIFGRATEVTATMDTLREAIESEDTCASTWRRRREFAIAWRTRMLIFKAILLALPISLRDADASRLNIWFMPAVRAFTERTKSCLFQYRTT